MATRDYIIRMAPDSGIRTACEDSGCEAWQFGWESAIDEATPLGGMQAAYIREKSGRVFREVRSASGLTVFRFEARQRCFAEHRTRPARLAVRDGGLVRRHASFGDLAEDYTDHIGRLAEQYERG